MPDKNKKTKKADKASKTRMDRAADMSDDLLASVEAAQRTAIQAVRKFVDTVDEVIPALGERPSRRETVIDAALSMADKLVSTQYEFLRNVVGDAERTLSSADDAPSEGDTGQRSSTTGKFEVYRDKAGKYRFRLQAANGQIIASGQGYESKASCMNGIESIKKNAADAEVVEVES